MTRIFLAVGLLTTVTSAAESGKVVYSARPFMTDMRLPVMDHGWLIFLEPDAPTVYVQRPDGTPAYTKAIQAPVGITATLYDAAVDAHGRVAVAAAYWSEETGSEGEIILLDSSGKQDAVYPTGRYLPQHLCFDPDQNIWTTGWQPDPVKRNKEDAQNYAVVRRYNSKMEQTGAFVNRSTFPRLAPPPGSASTGRWGIRWSRDHIGAYLMPGERRLWIELDRDGKELGRWTLDVENNSGLAFADGELYSVVSRRSGETTRVSNLVKLDRATGQWQILAESEEREGWGVVMDADGGKVVLAQDRGRSYRWVKP